MNYSVIQFLMAWNQTIYATRMTGLVPGARNVLTISARIQPI
jgi:hypothetical protein